VNVLVVGSGAVGTLLAWALARGGLAVTVVRRGAEGAGDRTVEVVRPDGTRDGAPVRVVPAAAAADPVPDVVLLAVKAFDVEVAVGSLPAWPEATLVTVQNGIGSEEAVLDHRPGAALIAASLTAAVALDEGLAVHWLRRGGIGVAGVRGPTAVPLDRLVEAFAAAGLPARRYPGWAAMKWSKLVANLVGNATSALLDRDPDAVYRDPRLFEVERAQIREALAVMRRRGLRPVALPGANVPGLRLAMSLPAAVARPILASIVGRARGGKAPSLRSHLEARGGRSEAAWLNGAVAAEGRRLGVPTPVNAALAGLLEAASSDPVARDAYRDRPDALLAALSGRRAAVSPAELDAGRTR
jgi:2-dehydropantoate 2-reductase